jgi:hypothetical protein
MDRNERQALRETIAEVGGWVERADAMLALRQSVEHDGLRALDDLRRAVVDVRRDGSTAWQVQPLGPEDDIRFRLIARRHHLPPLRGEDDEQLRELPRAVSTAIADTRSLFGARRLFSGRTKRDSAEDAAQYLVEYQGWGREVGLPQLIDRLTPRWDNPRLTVADALSADVGLEFRDGRFGQPEMIRATHAQALLGAIGAIDKALNDEAAYKQAAIKAGNEVRGLETRRLLGGMPVERLKEATRDRLRIAPLTAAGLTTVLAVLDSRSSLAVLPGIGETSAAQIKGAARTLYQATFDEMPMRIDINNRTRETTEFLRRLGEWDAARSLRNATSDLARAEELMPLARSLQPTHERLLVFRTGPLDVQEFLTGIKAVVARGAQVSTGSRGAWPPPTLGTTSSPAPSITSACSPNSGSSPKTRPRLMEIYPRRSSRLSGPCPSTRST